MSRGVIRYNHNAMLSMLAMLLAAFGQALSLAVPVPGSEIARLSLFLLHVPLVSLAAWAASLPRSTHPLPVAAGAIVGTLVVWAVVVVRRDAQEVGTFGAILEGLLIGGAIAVPGAALFLLLRGVFRSGGPWWRRKGCAG